MKRLSSIHDPVRRVLHGLGAPGQRARALRRPPGVQNAHRTSGEILSDSGPSPSSSHDFTSDAVIQRDARKNAVLTF
jgi:hypothetical protein